jgi:hypothetical protein
VRVTEGSTLLEVVARKRIIMKQQAGKVVADVVVICKVWRIAIEL